MAVGANAVLIPERLEFGAVSTTSIATQQNFNVNGPNARNVAAPGPALCRSAQPGAGPGRTWRKQQPSEPGW
jgi:hypothetical protein